MKNSEIRELSVQEINDRIAEEQAMYTKLKFNHSVSAIENPLKIKTTRKTIAKLKTELRSRVLNVPTEINN